MIRIINTSGDKAQGIININKIIYKDRSGKKLQIYKTDFDNLKELPAPISNGYRAINILIKTNEINEALKRYYEKLNHCHLKFGSNFKISGTFIFYFSDNKNGLRIVTIGGGIMSV